MAIREHRIADISVLNIDGRVTIQEGADALGAAFRRLIEKGRYNLVIDCQGIPHLDSSGVGEIIRAYTSVTRRGGALKLCNLTPLIHQVFATTKLLGVFETYADEDAAVESFGRATVPPPD